MTSKIPQYNTTEWLSMEDFEGEIWKSIPDYEGLYSVSNYGRIKSFSRKCITGSGGVYYTKPQILKYKKSRGYDSVALSKNAKAKYLRVARLVGFAFVPNKDNLPQINHKDCDPHNNCADNLEWCTQKYNNNYKDHNKKLSESRKRLFKEHPEMRKAFSDRQRNMWLKEGYRENQVAKQRVNKNCISVCQLSTKGEVIATFISAHEAERQTGIKAQNIGQSALHPGKIAGGYYWRFLKGGDHGRQRVL